MSGISTFECLPNELIICIFEYLKPAKNFKLFFDCNDRFRKLVKRHVTYNRRELDHDITRFSTLHSWYKHLNCIYGGVTFYMVPLKGEQERNNLDPCISDHVGVHWHFWEEIQTLSDKRIEHIIQKYPIKLNPLFYPDGPGFQIHRHEVQSFIRQYYPLQFEALAPTLFCRSYTKMLDILKFLTDDMRVPMQFIFENEPKRLRNVIQQAAYCIWKEIQLLEDVNILKIQ